jgi:3D (Asp-Asp-Asp) domain-containing protein
MNRELENDMTAENTAEEEIPEAPQEVYEAESGEYSDLGNGPDDGEYPEPEETGASEEPDSHEISESDIESAAKDYFSEMYSEEEIAEVAKKLEDTASDISIDEPIKTRSPEQNRNVENGIPAIHAETPEPEPANEPEKDDKKKSDNKAFWLMICAILVLLAVAAIVIFQGSNLGIKKSDYVSPDKTLDSQELPEVTEPVALYNVEIDFYDRSDISVFTKEMKLSDLLETIGCVLADDEVPSVPLDTVISADTRVTVEKHKTEILTVEEEIPFEKEVKETDLIMKGTAKTIQEGKNGKSKTEYRIEYVNGKEVSREKISYEVTEPAVNEIYEYGVGGTIVGNDGKTYTYSIRKIVTATHYHIPGPTYFGREADETVIAVDSSVIPLGTRLYVKNARFDFGLRTAADVGSIKGDTIAIWLSPSNYQYAAFAASGYVYDMEIYYIDGQ